MKKLIGYLLISTMLLFLIGCGKVKLKTKKTYLGKLLDEYEMIIDKYERILKQNKNNTSVLQSSLNQSGMELSNWNEKWNAANKSAKPGEYDKVKNRHSKLMQRGNRIFKIQVR